MIDEAEVGLGVAWTDEVSPPQQLHIWEYFVIWNLCCSVLGDWTKV